MLNLIIGYTIYLIQSIALSSFYLKLSNKPWTRLLPALARKTNPLGFVFSRSFDNKKNQYSIFNILLYSLALSPILTTLILYYLLLILPNYSATFYFTLTLLPYLILIVYSYKYIKSFKNLLIKSFTNLYKSNKINFFLITISIIFYIAIWQLIILNFPIKRHDLFIYGVQGKIFYNNKSINYTPNMFDPSTKFNYIAKHGFTSPLLYTWNLILNSTLQIPQNDFLFRSFSGYYLLLLTLQLWYLIKNKVNLISGYASVLLLALIPAISANIIFYHIDTIRIFYLNSFLILSAGIIYKAKENNEWIPYFILGIIGGLAINIHSLNLIMITIALILLLIYIPNNFISKVKKLTITGIFIVLSGGIHYLIDAIYGSGTLLHLFNMIINLVK